MVINQAALARIFHTHEDESQKNIRLPSGQSDGVAASPDSVGPTGRTLHSSGCEMFGLSAEVIEQLVATGKVPSGSVAAITLRN